MDRRERVLGGALTMYGVRPEQLDDEGRELLATALEELAGLVRQDGTITAGRLKTWPGYSDPAKFKHARVKGGRKTLLIGFEVSELPPACAAAARKFEK